MNAKKGKTMTTTHTSVEAGLPESLRLVEQYDYGDPEAHGNAWKVAVCNELRSQYAELETLRAKLKTYEFSDHPSPPVAQEAQEHVEIPAKCPYFGPSPHRDVWLERWYAACATQPSPVAPAVGYPPLPRVGAMKSRLENGSYEAMMDSYTQAPSRPAAVAGPSGYGPKVTVKRRCSDCKACNSESYAVQGDSGHYVYCEHPSLPERKYIGDTHWDTPDWCPAAAPTAHPAPQHQARPVTPYTCPKCSALWLHWPAEQSGFGRDTLNCRSTTHCDYCEKGGVEQLQRFERVPAVLAAPQQEAQ